MPDILLIFIETSSISQREQTRRHPDEVNEIGRKLSHPTQPTQPPQPPQAAQLTQPTLGYVSGGSRGGAGGGGVRPPLFLDQTEA